MFVRITGNVQFDETETGSWGRKGLLGLKITDFGAYSEIKKNNEELKNGNKFRK